ncbi:MAG TPA: hypothetical protein VFE46_00755 [Pirellulales bacterium]|jgi:hypothetical protein|nr:hypothetical protein [Pirellulales bacterium]
MSESVHFGEVLEAADQLSVDEKEELIAILRRRLAEEGRRRVIADVEEAGKEFKAGACKAVSVDELMREIQDN